MPAKTATRTFASLLLLSLGFASTAVAEGLARSGSFSLGNDLCDDTEPELAAQPDGTFLSVWQRCLPTKIAAQRFDALGRRLGPELDLGLGLYPQVAALPDRGFALVFLRQLEPNLEVYGVFASRLDPNGDMVRAAARVDQEGVESKVIQAVPRLAVAPDGRLFAAWRDLFVSPFPLPIVQLPAFGRMLDADLTPLGATFPLGAAGLIDDLEISFDETGKALAVTAFGGVVSRRYDDFGVQIGNAAEVGGGGLAVFNPRLAPRPGGGWWLAWEEDGSQQGSTSRTFLRPLNSNGRPAGPRIDTGLLGSGETVWPTVGVDPDGSVLVTGRDRLGAIQRRLFDEKGTPITPLAPLADPNPFPLGRAVLAENAATGFLALWQTGLDRALPPPPGSLAGWDLEGALLSPACSTPDAVCAKLGDAQAEVEVRWRLGTKSGFGRGIRVGHHLLFSLEFPGRFDVAVDLHGGAIDWAATTNDEVEIRWTEAGVTRIATKSRGRFASGRLENPSSSLASLPLAQKTLAPSAPITPLAVGVCSPSTTVGCLFNGRFRLTAVSTDAQGVELPAEVLAFADRQAYLSFGEAGGVAISLVDGRAGNGKIWVHWGGLSTSAYRIQVTDVSTETTRTYTNPAGKRQSKGDRQAF